jgi:hypothetical protein
MSTCLSRVRHETPAHQHKREFSPALQGELRTKRWQCKSLLLNHVGPGWRRRVGCPRRRASRQRLRCGRGSHRLGCARVVVTDCVVVVEGTDWVVVVEGTDSDAVGSWVVRGAATLRLLALRTANPLIGRSPQGGSPDLVGESGAHAMPSHPNDRPASTITLKSVEPWDRSQESATASNGTPSVVVAAASTTTSDLPAICPCSGKPGLYRLSTREPRHCTVRLHVSTTGA